jgi:hypothetical protein
MKGRKQKIDELAPLRELATAALVNVRKNPSRRLKKPTQKSLGDLKSPLGD